MPIDDGQTRVLSPELVLVDRELAVWARLRLEEEAVAARAAAAATDAAAVEPPAAVTDIDQGRRETRRPLRRLWLATAVTAAVVAGVAVYVRASTDSASKPTAAAETTPTPSGPVPFAWPSVHGARRYVFTLSRGRTVIYRAETTARQLALKHSWRYQGRQFRLTRGSYRWRVTALVSSPSSGARVVVSAPLRIGAKR